MSKNRSAQDLLEKIGWADVLADNSKIVRICRPFAIPMFQAKR
ncbi:MAG: hypothetical protein PHF29_04235 [Candidatus Riflebacteria bacterium]|nr:hypothetical protein [Candidatus Riflebacteria bacterium]